MVADAIELVLELVVVEVEVSKLDGVEFEFVSAKTGGEGGAKFNG
jgi:hypothetical protein